MFGGDILARRARDLLETWSEHTTGTALAYLFVCIFLVSGDEELRGAETSAGGVLHMNGRHGVGRPGPGVRAPPQPLSSRHPCTLLQTRVCSACATTHSKLL